MVDKLIKHYKDIIIPSLNEIPDWVNNCAIPSFDNAKKSFYDSPIRLNLDTSNWKKFHIADLFNLTKGKYYPKSSYNKGDTPLISASDTENGIADYTDLESTYNGDCLTLGKVKMSIFYQSFHFCCSHDVTVLEPLYRFNQYIGMFMKVVLEQNKYRYN